MSVTKEQDFITSEPVDFISLNGRKWKYRPFDSRALARVARENEVSDLIARMAVSRGVDPERSDLFFLPRLKSVLPDPYVMQDAKKATLYLVDAIKQKQKIAVFGDYDVDGGTSAAIMYRFLKQVGSEPIVKIPDRLKDGYGPNEQSFQALYEQGARLIITVDCGSSADEAIQKITDHGAKVIVFDHHITETGPDAAYAVVNPNRADDVSGLGDLTAAGVCFLMCIAINRALREAEYYKLNHLAEPDLLQLTDLAALGTVCDVAPLTGVNRALVATGLRIAAQAGNPGIAALSRVGRVTEKLNAFHLGFVLGPRVNAGGRVGRSSAGFEALTSDDSDRALALADELDVYNQERKEIEEHALEQAYVQIQNTGRENDAVILAWKSDWHAGVIGILAARIKEKFGKPAFVLGGEENGFFKGSGRSISGVDIGRAILQAVKADLLVAGGGHQAAAGLTVQADKIPDFQQFMNENLRSDVENSVASACSYLDADITSAGAKTLCDEAELLEPFGRANPSPVYRLRHVIPVFFKPIGTGHLRLTVKDEFEHTMNAVAFRCAESPIYEAMMQKDRKIDLIGALKRDTWNGKDGIQFIVDDVCYSNV